MINNQYERPIKFHFHYRVLLIDSVKTLSIYLGSLVHRCRMTPAYFSLTCPVLSVLRFVFGCILVFFSISCISLFWQEALLPHVDSSRQKYESHITWTYSAVPVYQHSILKDDASLQACRAAAIFCSLDLYPPITADGERGPKQIVGT